jgi:hypothetical protein
VLAVVVAFGLLIIGGIALWGALTSKEGEKTNSSTSAAPSTAGSAKPSTSASRVGNTVVIHCLVAQCPVFVSGPGPNDVQFNGNLGQDEKRVFNSTRLTVAVQDASTVTVTINGALQPRGRHGQARTYDVPS